MISRHPKSKTLYVEGAFRVWLRDAQVNYFILRGEPKPPPVAAEGDIDDVSSIKNWMHGQNYAHDLVELPNVHEQEDGDIFACCATGTSSKDSLLSWVRLLQRDCAHLAGVPVMFTLTSPLGPVVQLDDAATDIA